MKRDRQSEGEQLLRAAEVTLRESLVEFLPTVVKSGEPLFTNSHYNPHKLLRHYFSNKAVALIDSSLACVEMREALGLAVAGSVGQLFIEACKESASSNEHRRGPRKLAAVLLASLNHAA